MGDVVNLDTVTRLDIPAERVLEKAIERGLQSVVVIGYDNDGEEFFGFMYQTHQANRRARNMSSGGTPM